MTTQTQAPKMSELDLERVLIGTKKRLGLVPQLGYDYVHFRAARVVCPVCRGAGYGYFPDQCHLGRPRAQLSF